MQPCPSYKAIRALAAGIALAARRGDQVFPVQNQTVQNAHSVKTTAAGGPQTGTMCHRVGGRGGAQAEVMMKVFHRTQPGKSCVFDSWFYWNI